MPQRKTNELRSIEITPNYIHNPMGSCLIKMGQTWVLCTASVEEKVPPFMERKGKGWVTAEYCMLPASTHTRSKREAKSGKQSGRTQEIQRLIGRSLRACIDERLLGERTITVDCDVLQADGGTRIASINGGFVAMSIAIKKLMQKGKVEHNPIRSHVAGISMGLKDDKVYTDLDYDLDSTCDVDMNLVFLGNGSLVEIQGTAERGTFSFEQTQAMLGQGFEAVKEIVNKQSHAIETA
ncbi:ribonuclease PH [bacterium]|nr:ribonuclease PH [bacterium]